MPPSQIQKTAAVTGGTGAIGRAISRQLAEMGYSVVLCTRNETKSERTVQELQQSTKNPRISYELVDLSRSRSIKKLRNRWTGGLDILINNAGTTPKTRLETPEGIELQFATNVLGYFWMIRAFQDLLIESAPSRIVNVASYWAGGLDLQDLEFERRQYSNGAAYRQSKQADRMLTVAFSERLKKHDVTVNACHPGDVNSTLSNNLGFGGHQTPDQGAETPVWLSTSPAVEGITGKYFENKKQVPCPYIKDKEAAEALYNICAQYNDPSL
ncbi:MAG: SDR family NAD(P)-dependent oxidoreductase [Anaerolineales bacterium]